MSTGKSCPPAEPGRGPIFQEINASEHFIDLRKLPARYRKMTVCVLKDRDTGSEREVIVRWAGEVVYRSCDLKAVDGIKEDVENKRYRFTLRGDRLVVDFGGAGNYEGRERRAGRDRRSGRERRE